MKTPRFAGFAVAAIFALGGCGGGGGSSPEPVADTVEDVDTVEQDTGSITPDVDDELPIAQCPGVRTSVEGQCEDVPFGSGRCVESAADSCDDYRHTVGCLDENSDGYHDDAGPDAIFVDKNVAVGTGKGTIQEPFAAIGSAIAAAQDGDTIAIMAATYEEGIDLEGKANVRILGAGTCSGELPARIDAPAGAPAVRVSNGEGVEIAGLLIQGGNAGVSIEGQSAKVRLIELDVSKSGGHAVALSGIGVSEASLERLTVRDNSGFGCGVRVDSGASGTLTNVHARNTTGPGVCASESGALSIKQSTIEDSNGAGIAVRDSSVTVEECSVVRNDEAGIAFIGATGAGVVRASRASENGLAGVFVDAGGAVELRHVYAEGSLADSSGAGGYGIALGSSALNTTVQQCRADRTDAPGFAVFGSETGVPAAATPMSSADGRSLVEIASTGARGAAVFAAGAGALWLESAELDGAIADADGVGGDGVAVARTSLGGARVVVRNPARYGMSFAESKAVVTEATIENSGADPVVCSLPQCNTLKVEGITAKGNGEGLPLPYGAINGAGLVP
jgi:hypothetical protein